MSTRRLSIYPNSQSFEDNLFELQRNFTSLANNLRELDSINKSLLTFNNNFATFLQGLSLNSECFDFPEAPNADSYELAQRPATPPQMVSATGTVAGNQCDEGLDMMNLDEHSQRNAQDQLSAIARPRIAAAGGKQQSQQGKKRVVIKTESKRRKPVFQTRRITDLLASRFQEQPHKGMIERILKELHMNRDGMYVHEIVKDVGGGLTRNKCMDYMNALVHTEAVVRINKKGHLFFLDPEKYPQ
ncbi:DASH complex subunit dam1 [Coemansia umbellata]|uniref:DASH complex subunit DAM1 n=1 Tax=Coemansia umbellata TaxID=1424467 RepID=A0ABQ8PCM0_9FUNG|nr:DASH complex subunit dam1 [Coemansia umbellata]